MNSNRASSKAVGVIFAGGDGTRLWPVSNEVLPKQFNPILAADTLFVEAYERALLAFPRERIVVVTTKKLVSLIKHLIQIDDKNLIIQPSNADTAAAIAVTALHLQILFPDSIAVMLFSDHRITGLTNFISTIKRVTKIAAQQDSIICIGTTATEPETQYGYIRMGEPAGTDNLYQVENFTEKPDRKTAEVFVASQKYLWNTGVYVWKTAVLLQEMSRCAPDFYQELLQVRVETCGAAYHQLLERWFLEIEKTSFEKKITEKIKQLYVYKANYTWQDIGNWDSFYSASHKDIHGNAVLTTQADCQVDAIAAENCLVIPAQHRIALLGVKNLIVVQTDSTTLISDRKMAHRVKELKK